jgi:hypothetical protein
MNLWNVFKISSLWPINFNEFFIMNISIMPRKNSWEQWSSIDHAIEMFIYRTYRPYLQHNSIDAYKGVYCQSACTNWDAHTKEALIKMNY